VRKGDCRKESGELPRPLRRRLFLRGCWTVVIGSGGFGVKVWAAMAVGAGGGNLLLVLVVVIFPANASMAVVSIGCEGDFAAAA